MDELSEYVRGLPSAALRPYASYYSGYRDSGTTPAVHRGLPSPYLTLIFTLDDPLVITQHRGPGVGTRSYRSLLAGLDAVPALIAYGGRQSGVQVSLNPLGARVLLGCPAGELAGIELDAGDVLGPVAGEIRERMVRADTWARRFAVLDRALLSRMDERGEVDPRVRHAWGRLLGSGGTVSVAALAGELGWSTRHLSGRFATELGLSPKTAARVVRFDRARRALAGAPQSVAAVAAAHGYCDQSHFVRDFREFAGCAPTTWLAEEFRIVQAGAPVAAADSPA
ncbi:helix-turn-helix domain-containing protein [Actinokineospora pegani]|uniref:helix-turn-helix domain-containing protein n=1 Tax=Actinokineospora pegani TaxID=2654637 RepID=UPI0012EA4982|nr:helix-turn-helix domain-containing protein [Actinokineospora pegani]